MSDEQSSLDLNDVMCTLLLILLDEKHAINIFSRAICSDGDEVQRHLVARLEFLIEILRDRGFCGQPILIVALFVEKFPLIQISVLLWPSECSDPRLEEVFARLENRARLSRVSD